MRPEPGQVLHFSEDPTIARFVPRVSPTSKDRGAFVWAVDAVRSPDYWFPKQCPRAMAWVTPDTSPSDRERIIGPGGGDRVHAIEYDWLEEIRSVRLYAYRFDSTPFRPIGEPVSRAHVAEEPIEPLGPPEPVGDLLALHAEAGIQLRVLNILWPYWETITSSTCGFSGIRLRNSLGHPAHRPEARPRTLLGQVGSGGAPAERQNQRRAQDSPGESPSLDR
ncbi:DUF6886 family protein [Streptomyces iranensis]|uniref:Uncharacterized protein n=1 Tax=Streptomyces iranensis TaxID=576784 RepID=A0A061A4Q9_9ACTN|nr:DUF6886 family protein [Streptomyces iranensis]MBP2059617.1 hypothetical protein [Streptomyces iranensis]CDR10396.1 predicted protein [Streptomyces iranensis]